MLEDIVNKFKTDEYVELDSQEEGAVPQKTPVQIERLENFADSERLQRKVRDGHVMLVKIKSLKSKDVEELRRSVEKVRRTCLAVNGDIAGLGEDWLIVTPGGVKIHRENPTAAK